MVRQMKKTNVMRILDAAGIAYDSGSYDDDGEHELERGATERAAEKLGVPPEAVFKTIVMRTDTKEVCVFCVAAPDEINLKKARAAIGAKEVVPVKPSELPALTGYVRGGCSPIGMRKKYRTFLDSRAMDMERIYISAGVRGCHIALSPAALAEAAGAAVCPLAL